MKKNLLNFALFSIFLLGCNDPLPERIKSELEVDCDRIFAGSGGGYISNLSEESALTEAQKIIESGHLYMIYVHDDASGGYPPLSDDVRERFLSIPNDVIVQNLGHNIDGSGAYSLYGAEALERNSEACSAEHERFRDFARIVNTAIARHVIDATEN